MTKKYELATGEKLYKEGGATQIKSMMNVTQGHVYLTSERLVFCSKGILAAIFGPVVALFYKPTKITHEIKLRDIATVTKEKHGLVSKYVFRTTTGEPFSLQFTLGSDKWIEAIILGKKSCNVAVSTKQIGDMIEFIEAA